MAVTEKTRAIDQAISQIEKQFGKGSIMRLGSREKVDVPAIPTGSLSLDAALGDLPLIAEDLGVITPAVERLRDDLGLPGILVLQFAFGGGPRNPHRFEAHVEHRVAPEHPERARDDVQDA